MEESEEEEHDLRSAATTNPRGNDFCEKHEPVETTFKFMDERPL
jgi:hypothetical protein